MNLDDFTTEQLFPVLQMVTRMNVRVMHNWKAFPEQPWECRYYVLRSGAPAPEIEYARGRSMREVLVEAIVKASR